MAGNDRDGQGDEGQGGRDVGIAGAVKPGKARAIHQSLAMLGAAFLFLCVGGCRETSGVPDVHPIIGAWIVNMPEAPFPVHMFIFHADGTVQQSNPDAGDASTSDSSALGIWKPDGDGIRGKIVEITADRTTRRFASRADISFSLKLDGDAFSGEARAIFYDADGAKLKGPVVVTISGLRVKL